MKYFKKDIEAFEKRWIYDESGKIGYALLWLLGVPLPLLVLAYMVRHH